MDSRRTYFLLILLIGSTALAFFMFRPFLTPVALAAIFAVVLAPVHERLLSRIPSHPSIAALITVFASLILALIPISIIGSLVVTEAQQSYGSLVNNGGLSSIQSALVTAASSIEPYFPGATLGAQALSLQANAYAREGLGAVVSHAGSVFTGAAAFLLRLFIFLMALYYFLRNGRSLAKLLVKNSPLKSEETQLILKKLSNTVHSVVKGSLAIACIQGTLAGIGYAIFGLPNAALWGVTTAFSALIPGVGTSLILVPSVVYLVFVHHYGSAIGLTLWGSLLVGLIDNFLSPRLMGRGAELHPLVILLAVLGGVALYGPAGIFLGPLTVSLLFAVYAIYAKEARQ